MWIENEVLILFAGIAAEHKLAERHHWTGAGQDFGEAVDLASYLYSGPVLERFLTFMIERAKVIVEPPFTWTRIQAVAKALLELDALTGKQVRKICEDAILDAIRNR